MKKRLQMNFLVIAMISIVAVLLMTTVVFYNLFQDEVMENLHTCATVLEQDAEERDSTDWLKKSRKMDNIRVTLIHADGSVIADSDVDTDKLENHKERPEVQEALEKGEGKSIRTSRTLSRASYYYAVKLSNGNVLRLAKESQSFVSFLIRVSPFIGGIAVILFILSMFLSHILAKSIVKPIEKLAQNMEGEETTTGYRELVPFLSTIQKQHQDLVKSSKLRQEFTANVSHELKTPLTSISGYSELIESGMVEGEDSIRFAGEIHKNANRLLTLINDILQLSELDSKDFSDDYERVNLSETVNNCIKLLEMTAKKKSVSVSADELPSDCVVTGVAKMIEELVYNLIDNAIRYNKENGKVTIELKEQEDNVVLCVKDTGIGISRKDQERIFERFYRVDKGRSRETGGTGLGLAIVKHIVVVHDAAIEVNSEEGEGTEITVTFRKNNE